MKDDVVFITNTGVNPTRQTTRNNISLLNGQNTRNTGVFRSQCNEVELSRNGEITIVYNTSAFAIFTIFVINNNSTDITGYLQVSPDGIHFETDPTSTRTIEPDQLGIFVGKIFARFTSIVLNGPPYGHVQIYIQGQVA